MYIILYCACYESLTDSIVGVVLPALICYSSGIWFRILLTQRFPIVQYCDDPESL